MLFFISKVDEQLNFFGVIIVDQLNRENKFIVLRSYPQQTLKVKYLGVDIFLIRQLFHLSLNLQQTSTKFK